MEVRDLLGVHVFFSGKTDKDNWGKMGGDRPPSMTSLSLGPFPEEMTRLEIEDYMRSRILRGLLVVHFDLQWQWIRTEKKGHVYKFSRHVMIMFRCTRKDI